MKTKLLGLFLLAALAGCGANNGNNGNPDGGGGNGGTGGGGGGGCQSACTTAGATQCVDANNQQTCMMQNGCLQWVKSACTGAQICQSNSNGMPGGMCVTGVPCTCPTGFTCDANGVCQGGNVGAIPLDVKTVNASGTITLNGAAPTTNPSCNPDPTAAKATVTLVDTARGYSFSLPVPCSSTTFAWSGVIFPGSYKVTVTGAADLSSLPPQGFIANAQLDVNADVQNVALDVKTASIGGSITLNGAAPTTVAAACTNNPTAAKATVHLADATDGYAFDLSVPCSAADYSWGGSVFPGTYAVTVTGNKTYTNLPAVGYNASASLVVSGNVANQALDVKTVNVGGTVTLNGAAPTVSASCTGTSTASKAVVHFSDMKNGYRFDLPILCSTADFSWSGAVYPGNYAVTVDGGTLAYSNLPAQAFLANGSLALSADALGQALDVQTVNVAGTVTLNGSTPTAATGCTNFPTGTQATVKLYEMTKGYQFTYSIPCSATTLAWSGVAFPGTYKVMVSGSSTTYSTLPLQGFIAQPSLAVAADVTGQVLDVKTVNAAGTITLNGAAPSTATGCTGTTTASAATVTLSDATQGYLFTLNVPCSAAAQFAWSGAIFPGNYKVRVAGVQANSNLPTQPYLASSALAVTADVTGQVLDVKTKPIGGTVTLNGAQPSTSTACNPSPTATKATVSLSDATQGYSFTLPVSCSSASFGFSGVVYPGTYRISVAGSSTYSNLPTQQFLGTPRLAVQ